MFLYFKYSFSLPTQKADTYKKVHVFFMNLLTKLLQKRGIQKEDQLSPEEKKTFDNYRFVLTDEVTVERIKEFCQLQLELLQDTFGDSNNNPTRDANLKALIHVYRTMLKMIQAPDKQREVLELQLNRMINEPGVSP